MNLLPISLKLPQVGRQEFLSAVLLGLLGFLLNTIELQLGWGMHFIFGNALVFAFMRVLAPQSLVLGLSISSLWTIFLWNHPWAWVVWVCEAIFIAFFARGKSPVRSDIIFWIVIGAPLLLLTYGAVLKMDELSLLLVIVKQSANGILNVVLGELLYAAMIGLSPLKKHGNWPKLNVDSFVITILMAIILTPNFVYLAMDAPRWERSARQTAGQGLEYRLAISSTELNGWVESRSLLLRMQAKDQFDRNGARNQNLINELSPDFVHITVMGSGRSFRWSALANDHAMPIVDGQFTRDEISAQRGVRLVTAGSERARHSPQFSLVVPFNANGEAGVIIAQLRDGVLLKLVNAHGQGPKFAKFLVSPSQGVFPLNQSSLSLRQSVEALPMADRIMSLRSPVLIPDLSSGKAAMSGMRAAQILRSKIVSELPEWQIAAVTPLAPAVTEARQFQLQLFAALMMFVLIVAFIASRISRRMSQTLGWISKSAGDLAAAEAQPFKMPALLIEEIHEISGMLANAGTSVDRERVALASAQLRLANIARQAPVIIYALEVMENGEVKQTYVSDSLEKIMGYTQADAGVPGWWTGAIHPDDKDTRSAIFDIVSPGKVVDLEYRVRHKNGHYVWVWDSMLVETNPQTGKLEGSGVVMDISERKIASEQLLQADKMASLGRMISGTAHELNQPLNFIKMSVSNLRENTLRGRVDSERFLPKLENILAQVERASAILLQMRIFGRTQKELPYPINVKAAVDAVMFMVAPQFELDGTQVETVEKSGVVYVQALPVLLEQVLLNLVLNANDAIKTRYGRDPGAQGKIKITLERRSQLAVITVEDNGTGISADVLGKIFDPFFTTKPPKDGTGLGLSISYGIIRDLGGAIRAKSGRDGARFTVELPLAECPNDPDIQPADARIT